MMKYCGLQKNSFRTIFFVICILLIKCSLINAQTVGYNEDIFVIEGSYPSYTKISENRFVVSSEVGKDIWAKILDANGQNITNKFRVNTYTDGEQKGAIVKKINDTRFVIGWYGELEGDSGDKDGIACQIFDMEGKKIGNQFNVSSNNWYSFPLFSKRNILPLNNNRFLVYYDGFGPDDSDLEVMATIFDEDGNRIGDEFVVNSIIEDRQFLPNAGLINESRFIICWESRNQDSSSYGVYAQIYDFVGNRIGTEVQVNNYTRSDQRNPQFLSYDENKFLLCWESFGQDGDNWGIFAQFFDKDGEKLGDEFQVNSFSENDQNGSKLAKISKNKIIISWVSEEQDGSKNGVYAQLIDGSGNKLGSEFQINSTIHYNQQGQEILILDKEKFIVAWESRYQDGSKYGIYAQLFSNNSEKIGTEFRINSLTEDDQYGINLIKLNDEKSVISWGSFFQKDGGRGFGVFSKVILNNPVKHIFKNFDLISPKMDVTITTAKPNFKWESPLTQPIMYPWEYEYNIYIDEDSEFSNPMIIDGITDTSFQIDSLASGQTYFWKLLAKNFYGDSLWSSKVNGFYIEDGATDVDEEPSQLPEEFKLSQNYPNPFNPTTLIKYSIPVGQSNYHVVIKVYDVLGRLVKELVNKNQQPGNYEVEFNANKLTSGIYFYTIRAGKFNVTKKMVLMR